MIHERIHRRRQVEGMTIDELSAISGIPAADLEAFEADTQTPNSMELIKLGRALGVKTHYFFQPTLIKPEIKVNGRHYSINSTT